MKSKHFVLNRCTQCVVNREDNNYMTTFSMAHGFGLTSSTGWKTGVPVPEGPGNFLFVTASRTELRPTKPPIQRVPGALSLELMRPGRESDHSPPSSAEVKE
jgi:hypothetical protein